MKARTPIRRKRYTPRVVHSERTAHITGHKRVRLYGKAREQRRTEIFERAGGRCEEIWGFVALPTSEGPLILSARCKNPATEWSHKRHGSNKCDCLECGIASCSECHRRRHQPKACPKKVII